MADISSRDRDFPCAVVALGGNAITLEDQIGTYEQMEANCRQMARAIWQLCGAGWRVVVTHGNGPQVGNLAIQGQAAAHLVPNLPLHALDAMTQGLIGHLLSLALVNEACGPPPPVVSVVTHVTVSEDDPAFAHPTKPIGPFYSLDEGVAMAERHGWQVVEDSSRGLRRVVASPLPVEIVEIDALRRMVEAGMVVIAAGGGGVPVSAESPIRGIDAVVDKDRTAAVLAAALGAEALVLVTGVDSVMVDFGTDQARQIREASVSEMGGLLGEGQFPPGSMGPKVEAAIDFLERSGGMAVITSAACLADALSEDSEVGTRIVPDVVNVEQVAPQPTGRSRV